MPVVRYGWEQDVEEVNGQDVIYLPEAASVINVLLFAAYNRLPSTSILDVSRTSLSDFAFGHCSSEDIRNIRSVDNLGDVTDVCHFRVVLPDCSTPSVHYCSVECPRSARRRGVRFPILLSLDLSAITEEVAVEMGPFVPPEAVLAAS